MRGDRRTRAGLITRGAAAAAALLCVASAVHAATTTTSFTVQITIVATCVINSATTLNFSSTQGVLSANVDQTSTIQVTCTSSTPYSIGLSKGADSGATVAARKLSDGTNTITYSLYTDASRSTVWGNTVGVDVVSATGNGSAQSYTVYGRVPPQATPPPGTYNDTVTVTVNY